MPTTTSTEEERQARREADRQRTRQAVEALRASDGWQRWLRLRHHFHTYSLTNQLLIATAMPHATRVAGFKAWLGLGYAVRRGEHAVIRIWMPIPPTKKQLAAWQDAGADPNQKPRTRYRLGPVWDRSQVDPLPPPAQPIALDPPITQPEGDSLAWTFPKLTALTENLGCTLVIEHHPDGCGGCFMPELRVISINEKSSVNHQIKTLVHELSHALLHHTDLGDATLSYSQEELVVESIALSVVGSLGLDTSGYSIPYITSWSENEDSLEIIQTCAHLIDQLAKRIEDAIGDPPADPARAAA
jgi:antirestriction protein ArdC